MRLPSLLHLLFLRPSLGMTLARSDNDRHNRPPSPSALPPSWDAFAGEYEKRVEPFTSKFAEEMLGPLLGGGANDAGENGRESSAARKLLDVGCGTGAVTLLALSRGLDVVATDVSKAMVERTQERALAAIRARDAADPDPDRSRSQREAISDSAVAEGQDLPPRWSDSFDLAAANFSVIFFPRPVLGLREILRCLVPGTGIASLTAWGDASETPAFRVFPDVLAEARPEPAENRRITGSSEVLTNLLEEAGFVDVRVEGPAFKTLEAGSPSEYYDRFALTSPPTAATIAGMDAATRSKFRERVMEVAKSRGGRGDGSVALDSGAYVAYGRKPAPEEGPGTIGS